MRIKIKKMTDNACVPKQTLDGDAGLELYATVDKDIYPQEIYRCSTGIAMAIPDGFVGLIWDKSGIAVHGGIKTMGGVIDSNYRGEIDVVLCNLSQNIYHVRAGEKIAQILIQKVYCPDIEEVSVLEETERGSDNFGSTGLQ